MCKSECNFGGNGCGNIKLEKMVPPQVRNNCPFNYKIKVSNVGCNPVADVVVSDKIPANLKIKQSDPAVDRMEDGVAYWHLGSMAGNSEMLICIQAVAEGSGCITSCAKVTYDSPLCTSMNIVESRLELCKRAPECVVECDRIPVSYTIQNMGDATACQITIKDKLPEGLITCDGCSEVVFELAKLEPGQCQVFETTLDATDLGRFGSRATAVANACDSVESNYTMTEVIKPDLEVAIEGPSKQYICRDVNYNVTVKNTSNCMAKDTVLVAGVPECINFKFASDNGTFVRSAPGKITWCVGDLQPNETKSYQFTLLGNVPGILETEANVTAYCANCKMDSTKTVLAGVPAMLLEVIDVCDPIELGSTERYIVTVTNQGSASDTNIQLTCELEDSMEFLNASGATEGMLDGNMIKFQPLASLAAGDKASWQICVKAQSQGDVRFKASIISDQLQREVYETEATNFFAPFE